MDTNTTVTAPPPSGASAPKVFSRDEIRQAFSNSSSKVDEKLVHVFGITVAVKPPSLRELAQYNNLQAEGDETILARAIIGNTYVPGSDVKVFDDTDVEWMGEIRFGPDIRKLNTEINHMLTDMAIAEQVEDQTKSPAEEPDPVLRPVGSESPAAG